MGLRNAVFTGRVTRFALFRAECSLSGDTALQLFLHFRTGTVLNRVGATAGDQPKCDRT